jgi:hypothetical protein
MILVFPREYPMPGPWPDQFFAADCCAAPARLFPFEDDSAHDVGMLDGNRIKAGNCCRIIALCPAHRAA